MSKLKKIVYGIISSVVIILTIIDIKNNIENLDSRWEIYANIASVTLVGVLIWQVTLLHKQLDNSEKTSKLAYAPFLAPRFQNTRDGRSLMHLENIGNGSARDIHLIIRDETTQEDLVEINRFAFRVKEETGPLLDLQQHNVIRILGFYRDVTRNRIDENQIYRFPPEEVD